MRMGSFRRFARATMSLGIVAAIAVPLVADGQVFVYPRRPNKSQVRYYEFDWQHVDILVGPEADTSKADELNRQTAPPPTGRPPDDPGPSDAPHVTPSNQLPGQPATDPAGPAEGGAPAETGNQLRGSPDRPQAEWQYRLQQQGATSQPPPATGTGSTASPTVPSTAAPAPATTAAAADGGVATAPPFSGEADADGGAALLEPADGGSRQLTPGLLTGVGPEAPDAGAPPADLTASREPPFTARTLAPRRDPKELLGSATGGVRLFFYEREREVAERAAAMIVDSYVYLVGQFDYVPTQTFPYILYSSYQEFLQTNLFPLQEGTLGVTSPIDLKLTLPYFGDHQLFEEVSAHEMAHQFTIQKVRTATEKAEIWGEPLSSMPLWFIEGLAEYYAKRGIDPEAEMLVRDVVINPDFELGYVLLDFFEDRPWSFLWTYKMGQVRCAFLEETYGTGTIQRVLEESPRLVGEVRGRPSLEDFQMLLAKITGEQPKQLSAKFEAWLKRRAYRTFINASQSTPALAPLEGVEEQFIDALQASPSGDLLAVRAMDPDTGRSRLRVLDRRAPERDALVAVDGVPGVESLHPVWGRNFDLGDGQIAFVAENGGADVIYWQKLHHSAQRAAAAEGAEQTAPPGPQPGTVQPSTPPPVTGPITEPGAPTTAAMELPQEQWDVELDLGERQEFDVSKKGLIASYAPAFSPDGKRLAFIGLSPEGSRDVYVIDPDAAAEHGFRLTRVTEDVYSERQLAWGPDGIVFNSDATSHGRYNLFRVQPDAPGSLQRLTTEARDHLDPTVLADGRVLFSAYDRGRADIHEVRDGEIVRRTDISTGLFDLARGPDGGVWALYHHSGRRRPVIVPARHLLTLETLPQGEAAPAREIARRPLGESVPYAQYAPRNWELGPPFGFIGGGTGGIWGQLVASASDKLRNHALLLNVAVLGSFDLTDGYLVYLNQEKRITWGTGIFQTLVFRVDESLKDVTPQFFISSERFYGGLGSIRYPFNQFVYLQGDLSIGGVSYFLTRPEREFLQDPVINETGQDLFPIWEERNRGPRFQTEVTGRFGYDTIRYAAGTGPIAGSSLLLEATAAVQPFDRELFGTLRLDGERYFPIYGRTHLFLRAGGGTTFGGRLARQFALSTFDTIRGIPYGSLDWSIGRHFFFSNAELQVPLNAIIRVLILTDIEAIAGLDFGGVGSDFNEVWRRRVFSPVVGLNFGLGPLVLRLHFAKPLDIGSPYGVPSPLEEGSTHGEWVTNFSIRILGFEGFFDRRGDQGGAALHGPRPALVGGTGLR